MNLLKRLSDKKQMVHTLLLLIQTLTPIMMFIGIRYNIYFIIYLGLSLLILANITAALIK